MKGLAVEKGQKDLQMYETVQGYLESTQGEVRSSASHDGVSFTFNDTSFIYDPATGNSLGVGKDLLINSATGAKTALPFDTITKEKFFEAIKEIS